MCRQDHLALPSLAAVPEYREAEPVTAAQCEARLSCGLPRASWRGTAQGCLWLPAAAPRLQRRTELDIVSVARLGGGAANISLLIAGPSRLVLEVSTLPGSEASILQWSQGDIGPKPPRGSHGRPYLTTQLVSGHGQTGQHQLWVVVDNSAIYEQEGRGAGLVVGVAGHHQAGVERYSPLLRSFVDRHPAWLSLAAWTVDYKYYIL